MFNDVITLLKVESTRNEFGDIVQATRGRQVFCRIKSISQSEFYQASASGYKPSIKFQLSDCLEYQEEELAEYKGTMYRIIRTYTNEQDEIELVCQKGVDK